MDKVMLVTGASRGIGAVTARLAAERGYAVAVNYRSARSDAERVVAEIRASGGRAAAIGADVGREDEVVRLFAECDRQLGRVSALVNNAAIIAGQCRVDEIGAARLEAVFAANVFSLFYCAREALRRMSTRHGGTGGAIVNVSSAVSRHGGLPQEVHYAASKGAVDSFTIALAKEVGREGVRVNAVRPGLIATDIHDAHGGRQAIEALAPAAVPLGRIGSPREVAEAILWLASDAASYLHGAIIDVSGGR